VGLMPGVSGQFFKNFGLTVVVSVLMSLAVARMITPMLAAYFLHAKGQAAHGEGALMDRYMATLRWSLDSTAFRAMRARIGKVPSSPLFHLAAIPVGAAVLYLVYALWLASPAEEAAAEGSGLTWYVVAALLLLSYVVGGLVNLLIGLLWGRIVAYEANHFTARQRYL